MGVSGLLRNVIKKYPSIHLPAPNIKIPVSYLFIDFNAFIHDTIGAFPKNVFYDFTKQEDIEKYEKRLVELVIENTINLVTKIIKPSKLLYIAVDGPPPLAKMEQQRERRYKEPYMNRLSKKIIGLNYDKTRITAGTPLMEMFNKMFEKAISEKKFGKIAVIYDGSNIAGEAEHKYMKLIEQIEDNPEDNYVVISADGDVILLLLRFLSKNVWIMQKTDKPPFNKLYPPEQTYAYLNCKRLAESIYNDSIQQQYGGKLQITDVEKKLLTEMQVLKKVKNSVDERLSYLMDFVFLTFLEGNDFVKTIYFMKYKDDNMRTPLGIYNSQRKFNKNMRLVQWKDGNLTINQRFFMAIFKRLGNIETEKLANIKDKIEKNISRNYYKPPQPQNMPNEIEHKIFSNRTHILHKNYVKQYYELFSDSKNSYYKYFWNDNYNIDEICRSYLNILIFTLRYYFGTGLYWRMSYHGLVAPLPSDVFSFLEKNPNYFNSLKLEASTPIDPLVLLAFVLPPQSMTPDIFPAKYKKELLKEFPEYFPEDIELKLLQPGGKLIYAEPLLNLPSIELLEKVLKKIKLTEEEKKRNTIINAPYVHS